MKIMDELIICKIHPWTKEVIYNNNNSKNLNTLHNHFPLLHPQLLNWQKF